MRNSKIVDAYNSIQAGPEARNRVYRKALQTRQKSGAALKAAIVISTTAAIICLIVFGTILIAPRNDNAFVFRAYAAAPNDDGPASARAPNGMREINTLTTTIGFKSDLVNGTKSFLATIILGCDGKNIKSITYSTDFGSFCMLNGDMDEQGGIAYMNGARVWFDELAHYFHPSVVGMSSLDVVNMGSSFVQYGDDVQDDISLFLAADINDFSQVPARLTLLATAAFYDGSTKAEEITIPISIEAPMFEEPTAPSEESAAGSENIANYINLLNNIPYELCVIVEGSVRELEYDSVFDYQLGDNGTYGEGSFPVTAQSMEAAESCGFFDENGVFWIGSSLFDQVANYDGGDGYVAVIERGADGGYAGMVYRVPSEIIFSCLGA
ncbi:MAG: hypothetical protein FWH33_07635 [Oscillospiraceae bacterium]|nr:hypothetical protein [Oscillospiraceae bacterium]